MNGEYGESNVETGQSGTNIAAEIGYNPVPVVEQDKLSRINAGFAGISGLLTNVADLYDKIRYRPAPTGNVSDTNRSGTNALQTDQAALFGGRSPFDGIVGGIQPYLPLIVIAGGLLIVASFVRGR